MPRLRQRIHPPHLPGTPYQESPRKRRADLHLQPLWKLFLHQVCLVLHLTPFVTSQLTAHLEVWARDINPKTIQNLQAKVGPAYCYTHIEFGRQEGPSVWHVWGKVCPKSASHHPHQGHPLENQTVQVRRYYLKFPQSWNVTCRYYRFKLAFTHSPSDVTGFIIIKEADKLAK